MIIGIGTDIVEIKRIEKAFCYKSLSLRFFTNLENLYCEKKCKMKFHSYAGIFAAKEAFVKALGTGFRFGKWTDIEINHDEFGKPYVKVIGKYDEFLKAKNIKKIHLSISHSKEFAVANVILEE